MKPNWKDAPEWANYLAMDSDGTWYWYYEKPTLNGLIWNSPERVERAIAYVWEQSLEKRPE